MECVTSGIDLTSIPSPKAHPAAPAQEIRIARSKPRPGSANRSAHAAEFATFAEQIRDELNPRGLLETLMADHVAHSAWRLQASLERQVSRDLVTESSTDPSNSSKRIRPTTTEQAARSLKDAFVSFELIRSRSKSPRSSTVRHDQAIETQIEPNEWPIVPFEESDETPFATDSEADQVADWRDRLMFDFEVSDLSPVVKGTWVTVSHVVSLIVDGWTWADILRSHPELTEDDIRTCIAYAMDEENTSR